MEGKRFKVRIVTDWIGSNGLATVYEVYRPCESESDPENGDAVIYRSYNKRDARIEAAYRNKFGQ